MTEDRQVVYCGILLLYCWYTAAYGWSLTQKLFNGHMVGKRQILLKKPILLIQRDEARELRPGMNIKPKTVMNLLPMILVICIFSSVAPSFVARWTPSCCPLSSWCSVLKTHSFKAIEYDDFGDSRP